MAVCRETQFWDAFISPDTGNFVGKVVIGESIDEYMNDLSLKADGYGKNKTFTESRPGGEFDIKNNYPGHEKKSYHGFLFNGKYITLREAGNIMAGMNAARFGMSFDDFQRGAGALHQAGVFGAFMYNTFGTIYGNPPMYGEIPYQYLRSLNGYQLLTNE